MLSQEELWLLQEKYSGQKTEGFLTDCTRLANDEPLGYVIGHVPFLGHTIHLDSHPLIPRPETEFWVEKAIATIDHASHDQNDHQNVSVLDLCAGSGCIGVALASALPSARITFAELEAEHLSTIKKNADFNEIPNNRYTIVQSDLFENIKGSFDYILTNPPYIDPVLDRTQTSVTNFEPHRALYGGHLGLALIKKIITKAPHHLSPHGQLWIEHEPEQAAAIAVMGTHSGFSPSAHLDQFGRVRYSRLVLQ